MFLPYKTTNRNTSEVPEQGLRTPSLFFFPLLCVHYSVEAMLLKRQVRERNGRDFSMEVLDFIPHSVTTENTLKASKTLSLSAAF